MFWFFWHLVNQNPFNQLHRIVIGKHPRIDHLVILLHRQPKYRFRGRGGRDWWGNARHHPKVYPKITAPRKRSLRRQIPGSCPKIRYWCSLEPGSFSPRACSRFGGNTVSKLAGETNQTAPLPKIPRKPAPPPSARIGVLRRGFNVSFLSSPSSLPVLISNVRATGESPNAIWQSKAKLRPPGQFGRRRFRRGRFLAARALLPKTFLKSFPKSLDPTPPKNVFNARALGRLLGTSGLAPGMKSRTFFKSIQIDPLESRRLLTVTPVITILNNQMTYQAGQAVQVNGLSVTGGAHRALDLGRGNASSPHALSMGFRRYQSRLGIQPTPRFQCRPYLRYPRHLHDYPVHHQRKRRVMSVSPSRLSTSLPQRRRKRYTSTTLSPALPPIPMAAWMCPRLLPRFVFGDNTNCYSACETFTDATTINIPFSNVTITAYGPATHRSSGSRVGTTQFLPLIQTAVYRQRNHRQRPAIPGLAARIATAIQPGVEPTSSFATAISKPRRRLQLQPTRSASSRWTTSPACSRNISVTSKVWITFIWATLLYDSANHNFAPTLSMFSVTATMSPIFPWIGPGYASRSTTAPGFTGPITRFTTARSSPARQPERVVSNPGSVPVGSSSKTTVSFRWLLAG